MSTIAHTLVSALYMAFAMGWEILWPLILGFALSGVVQAVVTKGEMSRLLPDSSSRSIVIATALGAASSSCSYAAVALARSIFRTGADFVAAMAFQFASTNLVLELGIIVAVLIGWQFVAAEFAGGLIMVAGTRRLATAPKPTSPTVRPDSSTRSSGRSRSNSQPLPARVSASR